MGASGINPDPGGKALEPAQKPHCPFLFPPFLCFTGSKSWSREGSHRNLGLGQAEPALSFRSDKMDRNEDEAVSDRPTRAQRASEASPVPGASAELSAAPAKEKPKTYGRERAPGQLLFQLLHQPAPSSSAGPCWAFWPTRETVEKSCLPPSWLVFQQEHTCAADSLCIYLPTLLCAWCWAMDTQRGGSFAHTLRRATCRNLEGHGETPAPWKMVRAGHHRAHGSFQALQAEGPEWG